MNPKEQEISNENLLKINQFLSNNADCGTFVLRKKIGESPSWRPENEIEFIIKGYKEEVYTHVITTRLDEKGVSLQSLRDLLNRFKETLEDRKYSIKEEEEFLAPKVTLLLNFLNTLND